MARSYRHIKAYESEILKLKEKGFTKREIGNKLGFSKDQIHNFICRYNRNQRKLEECIYRTKLQSYEQARNLIDEYIHFYNNERIQLKTKLTPQEMRCQHVA